LSRTSAGGTNIQKALQVYQLWAQTYPRDFTPINNSGVNYQTLGQYDKALAEARREMALDPDSPLSYSNLAGPFLSLDRYDEAVAVLQQAKARDATTEAIADLHVVSPYELGSPGVLAIYLRGQAYLAAHQGPQAAAEFQKLIDHPGIVGVSPIASLARLGLARARALSGDKSGARKSYQDFFALWEHADPGIPILRQAKSEYAKLQ
jgi:tetratricopeptide (TPR) repeat protein